MFTTIVTRRYDSEKALIGSNSDVFLKELSSLTHATGGAALLLSFIEQQVPLWVHRGIPPLRQPHRTHRLVNQRWAHKPLVRP